MLVKGTLDPLGYEVDPITAVKSEIPVLIFGLIAAGVYFTLINNKMMKKYKKTDKGGNK